MNSFKDCQSRYILYGYLDARIRSRNFVGSCFLDFYISNLIINDALISRSYIVLKENDAQGSKINQFGWKL